MDYGMDAYENRMTVDFDNAYSEQDYAYDGYRAYQAELDRAERENDARDVRDERHAGEYEDVEVWIPDNGGAYITDEEWKAANHDEQLYIESPAHKTVRAYKI